MNMCAVAGEASIGTRCDHPEILPRALASASGLPQNPRARLVGQVFTRPGDRHLDEHRADGGHDRHREHTDSAHPALAVVVPPPAEDGGESRHVGHIMIAPARVAAPSG
jgi:hypothetical protein